MAVEHLLAIEADLHRPIEHQRRLGDDDLVVERIALAAEAAAVGRGDHADVRRRHRRAPWPARDAGSAASACSNRRRACRPDPSAPRVACCSIGRCVLPSKKNTSSKTWSAPAIASSTSPNCSATVLWTLPSIAVVVDARLGMREAVGGRRERAQRLVVDVDQVDGLRRRWPRRARSRRRRDRRRSAPCRGRARARRG